MHDSASPTKSPALEGLHRRLLNQALPLCGGDPHCAEDLVQDVFLRCLRRDQASLDMPAAWYRTVLRNRAAQLWAHRSLRSHGSESLPELTAETDGPLDRLCREERRQAVQRALTGLPTRYRLPIEARFLESQTLAEVGRSLNRPFHTVRTQLRRGRERLAESLVGDCEA